MRPQIVGPDIPEKPYPVVVRSQIVSGYGRGSSELGIPTANIPPGDLAVLEPGVYYGWAIVTPAASTKIPENEHGRKVEYNFGSDLGDVANKPLAMVMSIGWNPYYKNSKKSAEIHILHKFAHDFYGADIRIAVCGYIRAEQSYDSVEALVEDIHTDITVAKNSLARPAYTDAQKLIE